MATPAAIQSAASNYAVKVLQELSLCRTAAQFMEAVERLAAELAQAQGRVYRHDADKGKLLRLRLGGDGGAEPDEEIAVNEETLAGWCALHAESVVVGKETARYAFAKKAEALGKAAAVPLERYGSLVGVLTVTNAGRDIDAECLRSLQELGQVAGTVEQFVIRREDWQNYTTRAQEIFIRAIEFFGPDGEGHCMRVAQIASGIATLLDLSARAKQLLWQAALYHDMGILVMAGQDESEIERFHPRVGADFLASTNALRAVAPLVAVSQERYDGSGTPEGLKGDAVPIEGWVLALAEDVEDFHSLDPELPFIDWIEAFYEQRAPSHHPEAVEALTAFIDSGRMAPLYS